MRLGQADWSKGVDSHILAANFGVLQNIEQPARVAGFFWPGAIEVGCPIHSGRKGFGRCKDSVVPPMS